tara:strand:- start:18 stop:857 length:840 start_codon:yes stop_codon:yes gene_type:complete
VKNYRLIFLFFLFVSYSCTPKAVLLEQPKIVSIYFENKIKKLERKKSNLISHKRLLMKTRIEYAYGIIMEKADRLVDEDYFNAKKEYQKANTIFQEARSEGLEILSDRYPDFKDWLIAESVINFNENDIEDMYWLAASYGGCISSSRGNPFELVNLPYIGKLLKTCIQIQPGWNNGALYSAMMSFTTSRSDLNEKMLRDTIDYYFNQAIVFSGGMDAGLYVTYAQSIHRTFQERKEFEEKLNLVIEMDVFRNSDYELTNLIAKNRAKWLLSKTDDYFLE